MKLFRRLLFVSIVVTVTSAVLSCRSRKDKSAFSPEAAPAVTADINNLHDRPAEIYCACNAMLARYLVFDLVVENKLNKPQMVYAFVWATNDVISPPQRGIWPVTAAESCLTESGELNITDHTAGVMVYVAAQSTTTIADNTILKIGYFEGRPLEFHELRIELWSEDGARVFEKSIDIRPNRR